jgi:hypothetical protein
VRLSVDGVECSRHYVQVDLDVNGDWSADCGLYKGMLQVAGAQDLVDTRSYNEIIPAFGATSGGFANPSRGTSCWRYDYSAAPDTCQGPAELESNVSPQFGGLGACSPSLPCTGLGLTHCYGQRITGSSRILGPDMFAIGDCQFSRGLGAVNCEPPRPPARITVTNNGVTWSGEPLCFDTGDGTMVQLKDAASEELVFQIEGLVVSGVGSYPIANFHEFKKPRIWFKDGIAANAPTRGSRSGTFNVTKYEPDNFVAWVEATIDADMSTNSTSPTLELTGSLQCYMPR